jgi:hypothetical protein
LLEYEEREEFVNAIKRAKTRIEHFAEKHLYGVGQVTGPIFALKNFDWSDKQQTEHSGKVVTAVEWQVVDPKAEGQ